MPNQDKEHLPGFQMIYIKLALELIDRINITRILWSLQNPQKRIKSKHEEQRPQPQIMHVREQINEQLHALQKQLEELKTSLTTNDNDPTVAINKILILIMSSALLTAFCNGLVNLGISISKMNHSAGPFAGVFAQAPIILAAIDFLRIPAIYLAAWLTGEKVPVSKSNNARWAYAGVLLGLSIAGFAVPAVLPAILLATSSLAFTVSVFTFGRSLMNSRKATKSLKSVEIEIKNNVDELANLQKEVSTIDIALQQAIVNGAGQEKVSELTSEIALLQKKIREKNEIQASLTQQKNEFSNQQIKLFSSKFLDKSVGLGLSSLALAGMALMLLVPPVGGIILTGTAATGLTYLVAAKLLYPAARSILTHFKSAGKSSAPTAAPPATLTLDEREEHGPALLNTDETIDDSPHLLTRMFPVSHEGPHLELEEDSEPTLQSQPISDDQPTPTPPPVENTFTPSPYPKR